MVIVVKNRMAENVFDNVAMSIERDSEYETRSASASASDRSINRNMIRNNGCDPTINNNNNISESVIDCEDLIDSNNASAEKTLDKWTDQLTMIHYIYEATQDLFLSIERVMGYLIFILTAVTSFLAVWNVNNTAIAAISLSCTIITAADQVFDLRFRRQLYSSYLNDVHSFLSELISRKILPCNLRDHAQEMVIKNKDVFLRIVANAPDVPNYLYYRYQNRYNKKQVLSLKTSQIIRIV